MDDRNLLQHAEAGVVIGGYELVRRIGRGGMAEVWVARRPLGFRGTKFVALKLLADHYVGNERYGRMFRAEAELAALLSHANIVQVFDEGEEDGRSYLVMEWVDGVNLLKLQAVLCLIGDEEYRSRISAYIIGQLLHALKYAHSITSYDGSPLGVVHRDVSPQNVLISNQGEVKLTDFGVACQATEESSGVHVKGKIRYMSPEQLAGKTRSPVVDLYAVGALLHELLEGHRFRDSHDDARELISVVLSGKIPALSRPAPPPLDRLRVRLLEPDPHRRIQSAEEALAVLKTYPGYGDARDELTKLCSNLTGVVRPRVGPGLSTELPLADRHTTPFIGRLLARPIVDPAAGHVEPAAAPALAAAPILDPAGMMAAASGMPPGGSQAATERSIVGPPPPFGSSLTTHPFPTTTDALITGDTLFVEPQTLPEDDAEALVTTIPKGVPGPGVVLAPRQERSSEPVPVSVPAAVAAPPEEQAYPVAPAFAAVSSPTPTTASSDSAAPPGGPAEAASTPEARASDAASEPKSMVPQPSVLRTTARMGSRGPVVVPRPSVPQPAASMGIPGPVVPQPSMPQPAAQVGGPSPMVPQPSMLQPAAAMGTPGPVVPQPSMPQPAASTGTPEPVVPQPSMLQPAASMGIPGPVVPQSSMPMPMAAVPVGDPLGGPVGAPRFGAPGRPAHCTVPAFPHGGGAVQPPNDWPNEATMGSWPVQGGGSGDPGGLSASSMDREVTPVFIPRDGTDTSWEPVRVPGRSTGVVAAVLMCGLVAVALLSVGLTWMFSARQTEGSRVATQGPGVESRQAESPHTSVHTAVSPSKRGPSGDRGASARRDAVRADPDAAEDEASTEEGADGAPAASPGSEAEDEDEAAPAPDKAERSPRVKIKVHAKPGLTGAQLRIGTKTFSVGPKLHRTVSVTPGKKYVMWRSSQASRWRPGGTFVFRPGQTRRFTIGYASLEKGSG